MTVTLTPIPREGRRALEHLFQLYVHDFTEQWWDEGSRGDIGEDGLFPAYPYFDEYWREPSRMPLFIRDDGVIAGFVLLNAESHSGQQVDHNIAEYFVLRKYRRRGVAAQAFALTIAGRPGVWEAAVAEKNTGALRFWKRVISESANITAVEELQGDGTHWRGPIFRFRVQKG